MFISERLISLVAPHYCMVCEREGDVICKWCLPNAFSLLPSRCYKCLRHTKESETCKSCKARSRPQSVWVVSEYTGVAKQLITRLKFSRMRSTAALIADEMFHKIPNLDSSTIVCHIPTATSRRRQRGYDQAELIATSLARKSGLQHKALLLRKGHTRQVGADKKLRSTQLKDAFYSKKDLSGIKKVLLVDDLLTTGATIEAATNVLKDAGVKKVYATTFAQRSI